MKLTTRLLIVVCFFVYCYAARAAIISDVIFAIDAVGPAGNSASFEVPLTSGNISGDTLTWALTKPVPLTDDNGNQIGLLETANVMYVADPVVTLNFLVSSGGGGTFTVTSANLSFAGISNAIGRASSAVTVTDFGGDAASITGNFPNNDTYRAFYNDPGMVPATGTTFATLTPGISSSPFSSASSDEGYPDSLGGFTSMDENGGSLGTVSSMSAQWKFSVSANDSASGTSSFVIQIPEPASWLLCFLGIVGLGLIRRQ